MPRYYEDLDIGETYETGGYTVTKEEIIEFAEQFDPQPFHLDEEAAQDSMFGELVASGLHTLCLFVRLFVTEIVNGEVDIANMGGLGWTICAGTSRSVLGETLRVRVEVVGKTPSTNRSDRGYVDFRRSVVNDADEDVMSILLAQYRPPSKRARLASRARVLPPPQRVIIDWPSRVRASPFLVWDRCSVAERRPTVYVGGSE